MATNIINEKMWERSLSESIESSEWTTERYAATYLAYAIEAVLPVVEQKYPNLLNQALQNGQSAMQRAIALGADKSEMIVHDRITTAELDSHHLTTEDVGDNFDELQ